MKLNYTTLKTISCREISIPDEKLFELPEKVLQFGTGRLLRSLPDYYIDKANKAGIFNGRIVAVKSTAKGDVTAYIEQDNLYVICEREITNGEMIERNTISSAISRVLVAQDEWAEVLRCAHNKELQIIISNTTEVGIQLLTEDNFRKYPPISFPGKLLAFLYERFVAFGGNKESGMVIIPTELIVDNGKKLKSIVIKLARLNNLEVEFIEWIERCNSFCSSLVDRIVSVPNEEIAVILESRFGFKDELLTITEVYSLWAIEGDEYIKEILSFHKADKGIVIEPNIDLYRELKLRILNGSHTLVCGVAFLAGFDTVQHAMEDPLISSFISNLMYKEIGRSIPYEIGQAVIDDFITKVLDRFRNPNLNHHWKSITLNYSSKIRMRCIPLLLNYYKKNDDSVPPLFPLSFAAYLYFMKGVKQEGNNFFGWFNNEYYLIEDEKAGEFYSLWKEKNPEDLVRSVLGNESLWGSDLTLLPDFRQKVTEHLNSIMDAGVKAVLEDLSLL